MGKVSSVNLYKLCLFIIFILRISIKLWLLTFAPISSKDTVLSKQCLRFVWNNFKLRYLETPSFNIFIRSVRNGFFLRNGSLFEVFLLSMGNLSGNNEKSRIFRENDNFFEFFLLKVLE